MTTITKQPPRSGFKQIILLAVFATVLGSVFFCREYLSGTSVSNVDTLARYGCHFQEVSKKCGIDFIHQSPKKLDPRLAHIMPIIASMGASVSVVDFNRDGWPDLYVINSGEGTKNRLYKNNGDGTFTDVAEEMGIADLNRPGDGVCMGAIWGDFDNDGYEDLLAYRWGRPELFHNDKGKGFTRVTDQAGLPKWVNANSAVWLDFNLDGFLDLFIAGYWADDINLWKLESTQIMPESFQYANNGGRKYLLKNRGKDKNGKWLGFTDVTEAMGITSKRWTLSVAAADLRGTGYPDLVLANDYGVNEFYANLGGKKFVEIGKEPVKIDEDRIIAATRIGDQSKSGMSVSFGDIYNQGRFAIYVTNITEPGVLLQWNNLWVPERDRTGDKLRYVNLADSLGVAKGGWSWGAQFGDLNNDGLVDLFLSNGYISADKKATYWYDYSLIAGAHKAIISDAAKWPDMKGRSLGGYQQKCVWLNRGGKFVEIAKAVGVKDTYDGRAVALVDLWNRGVLDVVLANQNGPLLIYKNTVTKDNDWIQFDLEGTRSNKSAIGAQVRLYWNDKVQVQEVSGGNGYASQNQRRLHFGLGKDPRVEKAVIQWPSGQTQTIPAPKTGVRHPVKEPE
jgi:hypothetical protein